MELRDYQASNTDEIRAHFIAGLRSILYQLSTGGGKTAVAAFMVLEAMKRGKRVYFVAHRDFLLTQTSAALDLIGVNHGIISPRYNQALSLLVQVCSLQTLAKRYGALIPPDLIIIDEAHRSPSKTYRTILDAWPKARVVGLSATPKRLDGKPLGDIFQAIVKGPPMRELIQRGFLSDYDVYIPPIPGLDLKGLKTKFGDYILSEAAERVNKPTITGCAIEHYRKYLNGKRAIVFAAGVDHSKEVAAAFNAEGIPAKHIDGTTPQNERIAALRDFKDGKILVLCNAELMVEGFDCPAAEGVILLRPTKSLVIFLQACGRALRPAPGKKKAIILDHVGATLEHGLPDEEREWSLDGENRSKRKKDPSAAARTRQCPDCYMVHELFFEKCPGCGHLYEVKGRRIAEADGELHKVTKDEIERLRKSKRSEVGMAKSRADLEKIAAERNYKPGWVKRMMKLKHIPERTVASWLMDSCHCAVTKMPPCSFCTREADGDA